MLPVLVGDVCASVLRVAGEGRGFPEAAYDVCRRGAGSLPLGAKWRLSCAGAIALCLWMAMPYAVEITDGQNFGEGQLACNPLRLGGRCRHALSPSQIARAVLHPSRY